MQWIGEPEVELDEAQQAKETKKAEKLKAKKGPGKKKWYSKINLITYYKQYYINEAFSCIIATFPRSNLWLS